MIRTALVYLVASILGLFVEAAVIHGSFPFAVAPDFILVLVVILALYHHNVLGAIGAFTLGMLADFASAKYVGPNAAGSVLAFCLVGLIASRVYADRSIAIAVITFVCSLIKSTTFLIMQLIYVDNFLVHISHLELLRLVLWEAGLSAVVAPIVFRIVLWVRKESPQRAVSGSAAFGGWQETR